VTVCDRGGVKFAKSNVCIRYEQSQIAKDYNYTNTIIFNVQQILVITFEFIGAARGFLIMSCAARGFKKVGQHCSTVCSPWQGMPYDVACELGSSCMAH